MSAFLDQLDPAIPLAFLGLTGVGLLILALFSLWGGERLRLRKRLAHVIVRGKSDAGEGAALTVRRDETDSSIRSLDRLIKRLLPQPAKLRERLAATGLRITLGVYVLASLLIGFVVYLGLGPILGQKPLVAILFGCGAALGVPHMLVGFMIARRLRKFVQFFPEAVELIVRGLKSGLPIAESIKIVSQELPDPVNVEFRKIIDSFSLGLTLDQALLAATKRIDMAEFRFFVISLSVQQETGGNLTETLENLINILRKRRQMKLKIRAMSSEARASALIVGSLPFILFVALLFMKPDYALVMINDHRGHILLAAGIGTLLAGVGTMVKMAKFEI
jgi:tight adherence protein B